MARFTPPGFATDFDRSDDPEKLYDAWHNLINRYVTNNTNATNSRGDPMYPRFYNPLEVPNGVTPEKKTIPWDGFPRKISAWLGLDSNSNPEEWEPAFRAAEQLEEWALCLFNRRIIRSPYDPRQGVFNCFAVPETNQLDPSTMFSVKARLQDEYLEWHTSVNPDTGKVEKISFTAEGPEYWQTIAENDRNLLVELYQDYISDDIDEDELFWPADVILPVLVRGPRGLQVDGYIFSSVHTQGSYNQFNKWNTTHGAMHLIQRANTLGAEINLGADATLGYEARAGLDPTDDDRRFKLAACARYGGINRNSDPTIGYEINSLADQGLAVTISDPIGLYIGDVQVEGVRDPQGQSLRKQDIYTPKRGREGGDRPRILRFEIAPPAGADYGLEECELGDFSLAYGGPIARQTTIVIHGEAISSTAPNPIYRCSGKLCVHPDNPSYFDQIETEESCANVEWTAPFDEVPLAAAALVASTGEAMEPERAHDPVERRLMDDD